MSSIRPGEQKRVTNAGGSSVVNVGSSVSRCAKSGQGASPKGTDGQSRTATRPAGLSVFEQMGADEAARREYERELREGNR